MDPARDNPVIRSTPYLRGLGTFLIFALLLAAIGFFKHKDPETLEDVVAKTRYATKTQLVQAQADSLPQEVIDAAMPAVADQLAASKPVAVEIPEQVVPGSPTAAKLAPPKPVAPAAPDPLDPAAKDAGKPPVPEQDPPRP